MRAVDGRQRTVNGFLRMLLICILSTVYCLPSTALAQQTSDEPLEITAQQTLEWHHNDLQYIARGNVLVRQGDVEIAADTITADYRETDKSAFEIYRLTADGNVTISSQGNTATGERAVYEVDKEMAVMTGNNLRLTSPDQTVTAKDSFEYWVTEGRLTAKGAAHVTRLQDTLDADTVSATFAENAAGARQLKTLEADGNVRITTPTEMLTGHKGRYDAAANTAEITGNVRITRGPNVLEGERAEVNLTTNVSTMQGGAGQDNRVRGVFYPGSEEKMPQQSPQQTPSAPAPEAGQNRRNPMLLGQ